MLSCSVWARDPLGRVAWHPHPTTRVHHTSRRDYRMAAGARTAAGRSMTVNETQHGHLLLADISGYTSYVASTELRHSQEILSELLECIVERLKPLMTISQIEGDAIFAYT